MIIEMDPNYPASFCPGTFLHSRYKDPTQHRRFAHNQASNTNVAISWPRRVFFPCRAELTGVHHIAANRGFHSTGAKTRLQLISAAFDILGDEGYTAFTARKIAARAGVKPQLVHYYFRTMEELVVTVFDRSSAIYCEHHAQALSGPQSLLALWRLNCAMPEASRMLEFVALSKQYPLLRDEMRRKGESFRELQVDAISSVYALRGITDPQISPGALATLMSAVARTMVLENQVGMNTAHNETRMLVEAYLVKLEGGSDSSNLDHP